MSTVYHVVNEWTMRSFQAFRDVRGTYLYIKSTKWNDVKICYCGIEKVGCKYMERCNMKEYHSNEGLKF